MDWEKRLNAFKQLGVKLKYLSGAEVKALCDGTQSNNSWFTERSVKSALKGIEYYLEKTRLDLWISSYNMTNEANYNIGVVMPGNIPFAGFHDFLCVLISGYKLEAKLSSEDNYLPRRIADFLIEIEPSFKKNIEFKDLLKDVDAIIATGSNNSARYFNYYFSKKPNIIRRNRNSCAVLNGKETTEDLELLGKDIFTYFGLGCRSISKIYIPKEYDLRILVEGLEGYSEILHHHKYANNYDYNKSIYLINGVTHLDNGFLILKEDTGLASPISVIYYETYKDDKELTLRLESIKENIQCIVAKDSWFQGSIDLGKAQSPELWDYADGIDTMRFLQSLRHEPFIRN